MSNLLLPFTLTTELAAKIHIPMQTILLYNAPGFLMTKRKYMIRLTILLIISSIIALPIQAQPLTFVSAPPVVVRTEPQAGATDVDPKRTDIKVTFSKEMQDKSWSYVRASKETFPQLIGDPQYTDSMRTFILPVKLQPGSTYALWLNHEKFQNFKDKNGNAALPYLLIFQTSK